MALSPENTITCESILNKVATEIILAAPGSDNGLVPVYSLLTELINTIHGQDERWDNACNYVKSALDQLLDNVNPFDKQTLDFVTEFTTWSQESMIQMNNGSNDYPALEKPSWIQDNEGEEFEEQEENEVNISACEEILNQVATELVIASPGSDNGLVPSYSLITEFLDQVSGNTELIEAAQNVKQALSELLDNAEPFSAEIIEYLGDFTTWGQTSCHSLNQGQQISDKFPAFNAENSLATPRSITQKSASIEIPEVDPAEVQKIAKETDVLMDLGSEEDQEILGEFHTEAVEHLEQIEAALLVLENDPLHEESLSSIFRSFHTIKGVAGFLHLIPIQALAHDVESLLDLARNKKITLNSSMITLILQSQDTIQALVDQITLALEKGIMPDQVIPVSQLIVAVQQVAQEGLAIAAGGTPPPRKTSQPKKEAPREETNLEKPSESLSAAPINDAATPKAKKAVKRNNNAAARSTIRVNTVKLDNLMDMVGELVIVQSQLSESTKNENIDDNSPLQRNISQLQRITRELQHNSMALRLVPIKPTFQKIGRLVRDLASSFNKKVNFEVEGEDTELDRNVVEQIGDPLVHMVRNSLDHGLEPNAEDRIVAGKPEAGTIQLKAYHQGSNIVIELRDDGRGIDPQKILAKAKANGLIAENAEPSKHEILNMIFEPGFSTAEKITDVSGRGVGMDVVRRNIEKLRGKVELDSTIGKGTIFKIKLPLTTAIIDGLVVQVGNDKFILPTTSVKVALRPTEDQISKIKGTAEVLDLRGKTIPLVRLHEVFNIETEVTEHHKGIVVIIETIGRPFGLLVDEMLNKQEVVIKSLGSLIQGISGVAGGAILGDGTIALILDPFSLNKR